MKKIMSLAFAFLAFAALTSCDKEDTQKMLMACEQDYQSVPITQVGGWDSIPSYIGGKPNPVPNIRMTLNPTGSATPVELSVTVASEPLGAPSDTYGGLYYIGGIPASDSTFWLAHPNSQPYWYTIFVNWPDGSVCEYEVFFQFLEGAYANGRENQVLAPGDTLYVRH